MFKLSKLQQDLYDKLLDAEIQPRIKDNVLEYNKYEKDSYINDKGESIWFSEKTWASKINLNRRKIYRGHSNTLKALEKRGLIKCINIGGTFDVVEIDESVSSEKEVPILRKYKAIININQNIKYNYYFGTSFEGVENYIENELKRIYKGVPYKVTSEIILDDLQDFVIEYMEF